MPYLQYGYAKNFNYIVYFFWSRFQLLSWFFLFLHFLVRTNYFLMTNGEMSMLNIAHIRTNPEGFDANLKRRGIAPHAQKLIALDKAARTL